MSRPRAAALAWLRPIGGEADSATLSLTRTCPAFGIPFEQTLDPLPPYGVYPIPEAAMVGTTEQAAKGAGIDCEVGRGWFEHSPRAQIAGSTEGLIKLVFRRDDRRLLGVHIVGEIAGELIHHGQGAIGARSRAGRGQPRRRPAPPRR